MFHCSTVSIYHLTNHTGGTSIGSIVGALYAQEGKATGTRFRSRFKELAERMQNLVPMLMDLTYPSLALLTGRAFNRTSASVLHAMHCMGLCCMQCSSTLSAYYRQ